ncbi:MAG: helix-turn-helix domain-containing protein [Ilumatobacter sp.]|uniref:helix-turn-helix transcriptional regulator n=1 Tax=Ilumatobacter sp. TaxID=1967498 RepID=UPI00261AB38B|nr:helix-turn-helix domain-containing protein [Ilumatobacter sp.]MDJ0769264.1 helix-turn-helix domain-containing protein [Ilumatobacter sp.]
MADTSTPPTEVLITIEDASRRLALSRSKIYQLMAAGELTPIRIGRSCRLLAQEVAELPYRYAADHRV